MADLVESKGVTNPLLLLQAMIDKGSDPNILEKMMALAERWKANEAKEAYSLAMNACQAEMPTVVRDRLNGRTSRNYAPLETLQFKAKPIYTKHGFSLSFGEESSKIEGHTRVIVDVRHKDGHVERYGGDYPWDGKGAKGGDVMNPIQGHVSTNSYAQRDLIRMVFNMTIADSDQDGESSNPLIDEEEIFKLNELIEEYQQAKKLTPNPTKLFAWIASVIGMKELDNLGQIPRKSLPTIVAGIKALGKTKGGTQ